MDKEFVPHEIALAMKELGFIGDCFGCYTKDKELSLDFSSNQGEGHYFQECAVPLYQQAFRWFEEVHLMPSYIESSYHKFQGKVTHRYSYGDNKPESLHVFDTATINFWTCIVDFETKEEAQNACLNKFIEKVKENREGGRG